MSDSKKIDAKKPKTIRLPDTLGVIISTNIQNLGIFNYSSKMSSNDNRMFTSEDILFNSLVQLNDSDINKVTDYHSRISYFFNERNFYSLILKDNIGNFTKNIFEISNEKNEPRLSQINDNIGFNLKVTLETIFKPGETIRIDGRDYVILFYNILTANPIVVSKFDKNKQAAVNFNNIRYKDRKKLENEAKKDVEDLGDLLNLTEDKTTEVLDSSNSSNLEKAETPTTNLNQNGGSGSKAVTFDPKEEEKRQNDIKKGLYDMFRNNYEEPDTDSLNTISKTKYQIVIYLDLIEKQKYNPDQLRCTITKNQLTYHWNNILGSLVYQNLSLKTFKKSNQTKSSDGMAIKEKERLNEEEERKRKAIEKEKTRLKAEEEKAKKKLRLEAERLAAIEAARVAAVQGAARLKDEQEAVELEKKEASEQEAARLRAEQEAVDQKEAVRLEEAAAKRKSEEEVAADKAAAAIKEAEDEAAKKKSEEEESTKKKSE